MLDNTTRPNRLPAAPGVGYKPQHFTQILDNAHPVSWLEIHAENYMGDGGRPLAQLRHLSEQFPISVHGVGLSIGGEGPLDPDHLSRLKHLVGWLNPASFSEHLAWSMHDSHFLNDLLPVWALLDYVLDKSGPKPLLVEWDTDVPDWPILRAEADRAQAALDRVPA